MGKPGNSNDFLQPLSLLSIESNQYCGLPVKINHITNSLLHQCNSLNTAASCLDLIIICTQLTYC